MTDSEVDSEVNSNEVDVTEFFNEVNTINSVIEKRKVELKELISQSKMQLKFLKQLKETPDWIRSYLDQEQDLKQKIKSVLEKDA